MVIHFGTILLHFDVFGVDVFRSDLVANSFMCWLHVGTFLANAWPEFGSERQLETKNDVVLFSIAFLKENYTFRQARGARTAGKCGVRGSLKRCKMLSDFGTSKVRIWDPFGHHFDAPGGPKWVPEGDAKTHEQIKTI